MKRIAIVTLFLIFASGCSFPPNRHQSISIKSSESYADGSRAYPLIQTVTDPLIVEVEGESIVLLNLDDPYMLSFYSGCDGFDVDSLKIDVLYLNAYERGYLNKDYTFPIYKRNLYGEGFQIAIENGNRIDGYIEKSGWGGVVFDKDNVPISVAYWNNEGVQKVQESVWVQTDRYTESSDKIKAYIRYFEESIFVSTDQMCSELLKLEFDPGTTNVIIGELGTSSFDYLFADNDHEMILAGYNIIDNYSKIFLTPHEQLRRISEHYEMIESFYHVPSL